MDMQKEYDYLSGIMGVVVGDALGCPVEFERRVVRDRRPVRGMQGHGTFCLPEGSWTDDSSLTLAALASLRKKNRVDPDDMMHRFVRWLEKGEYTPFGRAFDIGRGTMNSIHRYEISEDSKTCGGITGHDNGNGSLMRIMPVCLFAAEKERSSEWTAEMAVSAVERVSGLTHNHPRAKTACGIYYFCVRRILHREGDTLMETLQKGIRDAEKFYALSRELGTFARLHDLEALRDTPRREIRSSGYVVDTIEAAFWSLVNTESYRDCELTAVNLGEDTDSVAAVSGGLAGLYYGYDAIPGEWLRVIQRREWIETLCKETAAETF